MTKHSLVEAIKAIQPSPLFAAMLELQKQDAERRQLFESIKPVHSQFVMQASQHFVELERVAAVMRERYETWVRPAQEFARRMEQLTAPVREFQRRIQEMAAPAQEFARRMQEITAPYQSMIAEAQRQLKLPGMQALFTSFKLQSRFWIVSDVALFREIIAQNFESERELEEFLVEYYTADNWAEIEALRAEWDASPSLTARITIIEDCLKAVKMAEGKAVNIANVVIPTLIAQIDGMMADLYKMILGKAVTLPQDKKAKHEFVMESVSQAVNVRAADMLHTVIIEGVFRHADAIEKSRAANDNREDADFNIFRHKIMHGDRNFLNYGTIENLTRFFLYADFLIQLITKIENGHEQQ